MGWFWADGARLESFAHSPDRDRKLAASAWFTAAVTGPLGPLVFWLLARGDENLPITRRNGRIAFTAYLAIQVAWGIYIVPVLLDQTRAQADFYTPFLTAVVVWLASAALAVIMGLRTLRQMDMLEA